MRVLASIAILVAGSAALLTSTSAGLDDKTLDAPTRSAPGLLAQDRPTFRASAELVVLHVSVRDRGGRYVAGLTKDAFTVIDDAKPQTLEMFSAQDVPATIGFLIDNSNSMQPSRARVIASSVAFARNAHPQDEIFVLTFNETVRRAWGPSIVESTSLDAFASTMNEAVVARGMTAIHDGLLAGLDYLTRARHTRQVLIVVSDGGDNASKGKLEDVVQRVHDSDATVYTVALIDRLVRGGDPRLLKRLARATGGESYAPRDVGDVSEAFERIATDIRSAYTLAYIPTISSRDAAERHRRTVRVYVRAPDGRALTVRTRDGYFEKSREGSQ